MTTTVLAPYLKQRFVTNDGFPAVGGTVTTYAAGTTTPIATYKDSVGTVNANPITLNARGECDIWLLPNVAYKFVVVDGNGNAIWTEDNVVQSQLITLYGGVDTGSANAYVLNFTASFQSLTDGIVIYWIPANSNTGASTLNVNGLGVVNVINANGSSLVAGEIVANQPAQVLYKGGNWLLTTATNTVYGTFTATWVGFSSAPPITSIPYRLNGPLATIIFPGTFGTSGGGSATALSLTGLPSVLQPVGFQIVNVPIVGLIDNSVNVAGGMCAVKAQVGLSPAAIVFYKDGTQGNWTASGNKGFSQNCSITYSIV